MTQDLASALRVSMLAQLQSITAPEPARARFNPRPAGVVREGSVTESVLRYLESAPGFRTEAQIRWVTKQPHGPVSRSLGFLVGQGLARAVPDVNRNSRYKRYCAVCHFPLKG